MKIGRVDDILTKYQNAEPITDNEISFIISRTNLLEELIEDLPKEFLLFKREILHINTIFSLMQSARERR